MVRHICLQEIPPFETKPVMRANFIGRAEMNHTAFIRIRTNRDQNEILVLPVEVEVTSCKSFDVCAKLFPRERLKSRTDVRFSVLSC